MKNIQIIDAAENCTFPLFAVTGDEFAALFPEDGQDIEFAGDVVARIGDHAFGSLMKPVWERPVAKEHVAGIHGTLFYGFESKKAAFPATKRERDWDRSALNAAQRRLRDQ